MQFFKNFDFPADSLHIFFIFDFRFFQYFHSNFFTCQYVSSKSDLSECTFAKSFS